MSFLGNMFQAVVNTVATPVVVVRDIVEGGKNRRTAKHVEEIGDEIGEGLDELTDGDFL